MRIAALLFVVLAAFARLNPAQESPRPNFTGRWRMDKTKSDFSKFRMPDLLVRVIDQHDPNMNVHLIQTSGQKTTTVDVTYRTDGAATNNIVNGRDATCRTFWDGKALVVRTEMKTSGNEDEQIEDRYELSENGRILTTTSHVTTSKGDVTMTLVSEKEASGAQ